MSIFLQDPKIKGETSDKNYSDWIDVLDVEFGVSRKITSATSTQCDRESANAVISDLVIKKLMDKATPYLFIETCCGIGRTLKIAMTKTGVGNGADVFAEYTLENALYAHMHTAHNGLRPVEKIKISFTKMTVKYISYDEDGNLEAPQTVGFDTATNTKV